MSGDAATNVAFEMTGGRRFTYASSWCTLRPPEFQTSWSGNWYVECEHGSVCMVDEKVYSAHWSLDGDGRPEWEPTDRVEVQPQPGSAQLHMLEQFLDELDGTAKAPTGVDDNVKSMAMVFAAVLAFEEKRTVNVRNMLR
jgi:predicted dehydrogenase